MSAPDAPGQGSLTPLRKALLTIERLEAELARREQAAREPLAIRSAALRFPGGVRDLSGLEQLLWNGVDASSEVPKERWDVDALHSPEREARGKIITRRGSFVEDVAGFDAAFFGISPREALHMDPQQRMLLELAWEAIERAGIAPDSLRGSRTGVFVGIGIGDWAVRLGRAGGLGEVDAYTGIGTGFAFAAGRVAFHLGLQGPTLSVDTACSSSLVALHLACQSLRAGECDLALVGGVHLMLAPETMVVLSRTGALAPDGRCKTFDARADGYGRGEGAAMVLLSRRSDVPTCAPRLLGLVRGSAVNHDGPSSALTVPNGPAQEAVLARALQNAGLAPHDVGYVEAHGTGTELGDPMEVQALAAVYARDRKTPLSIGSLKTNIGHLEACAGLAGLLKLCLVLERGQIPPHLHLKRKTPHVRWEGLPLEVSTRVTEWPEGQPRIAGVSAFGLSGTNAHALVEAAPELAAARAHEPRAELCVLSARTPRALRELAMQAAASVESSASAALGQLAYSLSACRTLLPERLAVVAESRAELSALLRTRASEPRELAPPRAPTAFLFTGQGSPYPGMGRELYESEPLFRSTVDQCDALARGHLTLLPGAAVRGELRAEALTDTTLAQPALYVLEVALAALWRSLGIVPDLVLGHSVGEIAAAHVAGALTLEQGLHFAIARGRAMGRLPRGGAMVSVRAEAARVEPLLAGKQGVSLAALNAPGQTVIAGDQGAVAAIVRLLEREGVVAIPLTVSHAFHSPLMDPALEEIGRAAPAALAPAIRFVSTLTGRLHTRAFDAAYWRDQARGAVRFSDALRSAWAEGVRTFVEVGPRPTLLSLARATLPEARALHASLTPGTPERTVLQKTLAALVEAGAPAKLEGAYDEPSRRYVAVPSYPFEHERFWVDSPTVRAEHDVPAPAEPAPPPAAGHEWLGEGRKLASGEREFRALLRDEGQLAEHRVGGSALLPLSWLVDAAWHAVASAAPADGLALELELGRPLFVASGEPQELELTVSARGEDRAIVRVRARAAGSDEEPAEIASGTATRRAVREPAAQDLAALRARLTMPLALDELAVRLREHGVEHGPSYRGLSEARVGQGELLARVRPDAGERMAWDLAIQAVGLAAFAGEDGPLLFPSAVGELRVEQPGTPSFVHARAERDASGRVLGSADLLDEEGRVLRGVRELRLIPSTVEELLRTRDARLFGWTHRVVFRALPAEDVQPSAGRWLILSEGGAVSTALRKALVDAGSRVAQAFVGTRFRELEPGLYELDAGDEASYLELLTRARAALEGPLTGVLHCWAQRGESVESAQLAVESALALARALARSDELTRLFLITRGAQVVGEESAADLTVFQSPMWGLGRALQVEQPELTLGLVDLDPAALRDHGHNLLRALCGSEDQLAFRDGVAHGARLSALTAEQVAELAHAPAPGLDPHSIYLVTGGLGGLGLQALGWLVERGARRVDVLSRSEPGDEARAQLASLTARGLTVRTHRCDVSDRVALERTLGTLQAEGLSVRGVLHAAAVIDDALVDAQDRQRVRSVLAPKLAGTYHLCELLREEPLAFFFCFSSLVSILGSAGQANYAAANAFLDALAVRERAAGRPFTSVQWGPWAGAGTAQTLADQRRWSELGLGKIPPRLGLRALELCIASGVSSLAVLPISWSRFLGRIPAERTPPLLSELRALHGTTQGSARARDEALLARLAQLSPNEKQGLLLEHVRSEAARVLRVSSPAALASTRPLAELGFDSLLAVELRNALQACLGVSIKVSTLFEHPTLEGLAQALVRQGQTAPSTNTVRSMTPGPAPVAHGLDLSLIYFASGTSGPDHDKYRHVLAQARMADQAGFKAIWIPERHFYELGALYPDPSVLAAALATVTERVRLRAGSVVVPLHHPLALAERWAMVDNLSGGRVDLSVATGWSPADFVLAPEHYPERLRVMREGVAQLSRLWRGEALSLRDGNGQPSSVRVFPRPVQPELTLWYTCSGGVERFVEAGRAGAHVLTALLFQTHEELAEKIAAYRAARASAGHDPSTGIVTLMLHTYLAERDDELVPAIHAPFVRYLESTARVWLNASSADTVRNVEQMSEAERADVLELAFQRYVHTAGLFGTLESCRVRLHELARVGVNEVACLVDFGLPAELVEQSLRRLAGLLSPLPAQEELVL